MQNIDTAIQFHALDFEFLFVARRGYAGLLNLKFTEKRALHFLQTLARQCVQWMGFAMIVVVVVIVVVYPVSVCLLSDGHPFFP